MIKISPNLAILGTTVISFAAAITLIAAALSPTHKFQVKGTSAALASKSTGNQPSDPVPGDAGTPAPTNDLAPSDNAATPSLGASSVPAALQPTNPSGPTTPAPSDTTPVPQPSYHIALRTDQEYRSQPSPTTNPDMWQLIIPFDIVLDPGFVPQQADAPSCTFLSTPADDYNVLCNVSEKDKGYLGIQYDGTSAHGHYKVKVTYTLDNIVRTDTADFDL